MEITRFYCGYYRHANPAGGSTGIGTGFNKEHTIIWSKNYNLKGRNSNNTSGWPENWKSRQIVWETPTPDVIFLISPTVFYEVTIWIAT